MNEMPKVSVLMPIYNTNESYLREAIESVLEQTFRDFEFLILNDSPENSLLDGVVRSYSDSRIRYLRNDRNIGISESRNKLLQMAQGVYVAVMDHDDVSLPARFQKQVDFLDNNPDYGVVGCRVVEEPHGKVRQVWIEDDEIRLAMMGGCALFHSAAMIRKTVLAVNGIRYEPEFTPAEDHRLWCRLLLVTKFHNIPEVLFRYRCYGGNTSNKEKDQMGRVALKLAARREIENPVLYREFLLKSTHTTYVSLLGVIPLLKIVACGRLTNYYLFHFLPLFRCVKTRKMK